MPAEVWSPSGRGCRHSSLFRSTAAFSADNSPISNCLSPSSEHSPRKPDDVRAPEGASTTRRRVSPVWLKAYSIPSWDMREDETSSRRALQRAGAAESMDILKARQKARPLIHVPAACRAESSHCSQQETANAVHCRRG